MTNECPKCQTNNPDTVKFCGECGTPLEADVVHTRTLETPAEELKRGTIFAGRYEIIEELGKGGMGRVYRVEDKKIKQEIALKLIKPEIASDKKTIERFKNELTTTRNIRHKNVCGMFDLGEEKEQHFITMEYVSGGDLKRLIRRVGQLPTGKAISIAKQICSGLEEAHSLGIVHRDLKPNNIMIDDNGNARIMDFGIARTVKEKGITGSGVMIGTPEYMSPEQVEAKDVDQRSDIYSLGIILYEMLARRLPFEGDSSFAIGVKHKSEIPKDPKSFNPQISEDLSKIILICLEKDKDNRYQSVGEVKSELERIEQGFPTTDRIMAEKKPLTSREITVSFNVKKLLWPALLTILVLAALVIFWHPWSKDSPGQISLAVLPFEDISPQKDQESFCAGMTIQIINKLSKIKSWRVLPATTMNQYKRTELNLANVARELNASHILESQLSMEGDELQVVANLWDVGRDRTIPVYSELSNVGKTFDIQTEIAKNIATELEAELTPENKLKMEKQPTTSLEAFNLYNKGIEYYLRLQEEDNEQAIVLFERAKELDPKFAQAYARLADAYRQRVIRFNYPDSWFDESIKLSMQALEIDPDCAEAYQAVGAVYMARNRNQEAIDWEQEALDRNPNLIIALLNLANLYIEISEVEQAYHLIKRALSLEPSRAFSHVLLAFAFMTLDEYQKAEKSLDNALLYQPDLSLAYQSMIWCQIHQEHYDRAFEYGQKYLTQYPDGNGPNTYMGLIHLYDRNYDKALEFFEMTESGELRGGLYIKMGRLEEGEKLLQEHIDGLQAQLDQGNEAGRIPIDIATNYAVRGDRDKAYDWLERASETGWVYVKLFANHPFWEEFYEDEKYKQIFADINNKSEDIRMRIKDE